MRTGPSYSTYYESKPIYQYDDRPTPIPMYVRNGTCGWLIESSPHYFSGGKWRNDPSKFCTSKETFLMTPSNRAHCINSSGKSTFASHFIGINRELSIAGDELGERSPPDLISFADYVLQLNADGTNLYKRARPGNPIATLGQFLIELRDFPRIPVGLHERLDTLRRFGDEYLNVQFGWKPFIQDLQKAYRLYKTLDKRLTELINYNDKWIKRRRANQPSSDLTKAEERFILQHNGVQQDDQIEAMEVFLETAFQLYNPSWNRFEIADFGMIYDPRQCPVGDLARVISYEYEKRTEVSFTGSFYYYVPDIGSSQWNQRATDALFGTKPTPDLLWSVLPWSWFIDWFTNVGDIISNASENAVENELSMDTYVYRTEIESLKVTSTMEFPRYIDYGTAPGAYTSIASFEKRKQFRQPATPYGFGVTFDSLSTAQYAILAALGLSRQRFL